MWPTSVQTQISVFPQRKSSRVRNLAFEIQRDTGKVRTRDKKWNPEYPVTHDKILVNLRSLHL